MLNINLIHPQNFSKFNKNLCEKKKIMDGKYEQHDRIFVN